MSDTVAETITTTILIADPANDYTLDDELIVDLHDFANHHRMTIVLDETEGIVVAMVSGTVSQACLVRLVYGNRALILSAR